MMTAASSLASSLGLRVDDVVVLHDSSKQTLRLLPCDVVARVARVGELAAFELDLAQQLRAAGCPVAAPAPRLRPEVYEWDGFVVTFWTHYESALPAGIPPADFARRSPGCTPGCAPSTSLSRT